MNISLYNLGKKQTNILKGVAIFFIVLHNFLHVTHSVGENQVIFDSNRIYNLLEQFKLDPSFIIGGSLSFWTIFFLQLFIFSSGYGLMKGYLKNDTISYKDYIKPRLLKLYSLIVFGLIITFIVCCLILKKIELITFIKDTVLFTVGLPFKNITLSLTYRYAGAWWYFTPAIQFYLIFPFLYKLMKKYQEKGFIIMLVSSYILIFTAYYSLNADNRFIVFTNFLGYLPEFLLGMALARFKNIKLSLKIFIPALILLVLSNFCEWAYLFSFLSGAIVLLVCLYPLYRNPESNNILSRVFFYIGGISMYIFIFNSQIGRLIHEQIGDQTALGYLGYSFVCLVICLLFAYLMSLAHKYLESKIGFLNK